MLLAHSNEIIRRHKPFQMGRLQWSDDSPASFMQWNKHYFRNRGPEILQQLSAYYSSAAEDYNYVIAEARSHIQPPYKEHHVCTVLMGSPGPLDMEFVTLPCNRKTEVAGIMCIKRNKVVLDQKQRLVYTLIHYTTKTTS